MSEADGELRLAIYDLILRTGRVPSIATIARALAVADNVVRAGLRRLADIHAFVISDAGEIEMAHPFSALPTAYTVVADGVSFFANCAWDALAIPALLKINARVAAQCHCSCNDPIVLEFDNGMLTPVDAVVHFAVPPRRFYDDVHFT